MSNVKFTTSLSAGVALLLTPAAWAVNVILDNANGTPDTELRTRVNATQASVTDLISTVCPRGGNEAQFQTRCNAFVNFALTRRAATGEDPNWRDTYANALQQVAPEQFISQGTAATRAAGNLIGSRLAALRLGARGFNVAGINFNGRDAAFNVADGFGRPGRGGGAGDATAPIWNRLGFFFNGMGTFGDVDNTHNQIGFDFRSAGVTTGADYRFSESLILGAAFTYLRMESDFNRNQGSLNSDTYSGSLYGTYYLPSGFYVDALGTVGGLQYDSIRDINYDLTDRNTRETFDQVRTQATATPGGMQYVGSLGLGYNQSFGGVNVNPYLRGNYNRLDVDGFNERGGSGMAVGFSDQTVESVTSVFGAQLSYAISTAKSVFTPYLRGEWRHEFEDNSRIIPVRFLGNTAAPGLAFSTVTDNPDRNYFNVGAGVSATFAHGVSAFVNYDTLLGYRAISSHAFMAGVRVEI